MTGNATEHSYRPALKSLLEAVVPGITATNEPRRIDCGAPDYIITQNGIPLGFVEAKDIGKPLDEIEKSDQLRRYLESLPNLILTDYLEFRWYAQGSRRLAACLAKTQTSGKLRLETGGAEELEELLRGFLTAKIPVVSSPRDLAERMAALARLVHSIIAKTFAAEGERGALHEQMEGFRRILLHDLTAEQFSDMYAQTICYGLFAARCNHDGGSFTRERAAYELPKTNSFLRELFSHIAGPGLDDRISWIVDNLAELLNRADMAAILKDFGRATRQEDPVVHFYETFLAAYDSKMRETRGVYYTPEPVVSYIVRSVDRILKKDFKTSKGLADEAKIKVERPKENRKGMEKVEVHRVQILDPATGTGTFLHQTISHIHEGFKGNQGLWSGYVRENLLPRLYGFELLMAPYAVAHMKLGMLLRETKYDFATEERLRVYLTNSLEEAHEMTGLPLFTQWLSKEANRANEIKKDAPVMVVLGNPPYSGHSANRGEWIANLLHGMDGNAATGGDYFQVDGKPLGEKNPKWLNDDYVKFIRFAQWRIEKTGYGVLAFVTNHGYLDNPTFRGMRQALMRSFDDIYVLDLHGNSKKKEKAPDGGKDENVFDIQQGVAIGLFVKRGKKQTESARVRHAELFGLRKDKYKVLAETDCANTDWEELKPQSPFYLFVPQNTGLLAEYEKGWKITEALPVNGVGLTTARDSIVINFEKEPILARALAFRDAPESNEEICRKLGIPLKKGWDISRARKLIRAENDLHRHIRPILYRPFDERLIFYHDSLVWRTVKQIMRHMLAGKNLGLITVRQVAEGIFNHALVSSSIIESRMTLSNKGIGFLFPLYLYPEPPEMFGDSGSRRSNLAPEFIADFSAKLKLSFAPDGKGDLKKTFGPEDVFHYAYAVFYSPTYRKRYAEFLKMDFPRLPLTSNTALFRKLCSFGEELTSLHLMEKSPESKVRYPVNGDNAVENVRYAEPAKGLLGRVWINAAQYFENVPPEVWEYHVGGYQVCQKWLKDRKGRKLSYDELTHYRGIISALGRTIDIQAEIDQAVGKWPLR